MSHLLQEFWPERWEAKPAEGGMQEGSSSASAGLDPAPTPTGHASNPSKTYLPFSDGKCLTHHGVGSGNLALAPNKLCLIHGGWKSLRKYMAA